MADKAHGAHDVGSDLERQMDTLREELAAIAGVVGEIAGPAARKRLRRQAKKLGGQAQSALSDAEDQVKDTGEAIQDAIRERPVQSALLAFGLGIALAKLFLDRDR